MLPPVQRYFWSCHKRNKLRVKKSSRSITMLRKTDILWLFFIFLISIYLINSFFNFFWFFFEFFFFLIFKILLWFFLCNIWNLFKNSFWPRKYGRALRFLTTWPSSRNWPASTCEDWSWTSRQTRCPACNVETPDRRTRSRRTRRPHGATHPPAGTLGPAWSDRRTHSTEWCPEWPPPKNMKQINKHNQFLQFERRNKKQAKRDAQLGKAVKKPTTPCDTDIFLSLFHTIFGQKAWNNKSKIIIEQPNEIIIQISSKDDEISFKKRFPNKIFFLFYL